jgi:release factor glutamine methyltransferase
MQAAPDRPATAAHLLGDARGLGVPRLDAMALLSHHARVTRSWLIAHDDEPLPPSVIDGVRGDLARRAAGEPLAYLVGRREFHGLDLEVTPDVLIPRPETECLVDWALEVMPRRDDHAREPVIAVDLGTGSGAIAIAVAQALTDAQVHAVDVSTAALAVARRNVQRLGVAVTFHAGNWWHAEGMLALRGRIALAVSNPPYVRAGDPHLAALVHEPSLALLGGDDGLEAIRAIVSDARGCLGDGGRLLLEHGFDQGLAVRELLHRHGFVAVETRRDLGGHERCTGGIHHP